MNKIKHLAKINAVILYNRVPIRKIYYWSVYESYQSVWLSSLHTYEMVTPPDSETDQ